MREELKRRVMAAEENAHLGQLQVSWSQLNLKINSDARALIRFSFVTDYKFITFLLQLIHIIVILRLCSAYCASVQPAF